MTSIQILLARSKYDANNYEETLVICDNILKKDGKNVSALWMKGDCLRLLNKFEESIVRYAEVLQLDSKHEKSLAGMGSSLTQIGKLKDALIYLDKAIELDPNICLHFM
jgi:tetratricopeptide (TPR) repeat protein